MLGEGSGAGGFVSPAVVLRIHPLYKYIIGYDMGILLVACEESQTVTKAFRKYGIEAYSADIKPCSGGHPEWHIQGDVFDIDLSRFDMIIAHPPCTYLTKAQQRALFIEDPSRYEKQIQAAQIFMRFYNLPVRHLCIENPIPFKSVGLPEYTQIIQPYNFGEPYSKATCLWLRGLPMLFNTCICDEYKSFVYTRIGSEKRSKTLPGIAEAMAKQWKSYLT